MSNAYNHYTNGTVGKAPTMLKAQVLVATVLKALVKAAPVPVTLVLVAPVLVTLVLFALSTGASGASNTTGDTSTDVTSTCARINFLQPWRL